MAARKHTTNVLVLVLLSLITSFFIILSLKPKSEPVKVSKKEADKVSLADKEIEIDEPEEIDLSIFAPFFFWKKTNSEKLVLAQYTKDGKEIEYPSITKIPDIIRQEDPKRVNNIEDVKVGNLHKKLALIKNIKSDGPISIDDLIQIFDTENNSFFAFSVSPDKYDFSTHNLMDNSWSPNDKYLYFLYSSENEKNHNIWVINTETKSAKALLNGYDINILGWVNNSELAYYVYPIPNQKEVEIMSIDAGSGAKQKIGFCPNIWLNQCIFSHNAFPEYNILFSEIGNNTKIFVYNYKFQTGKELTDTWDNIEFSRAQILDFSPDKKYMFFGIHQSYVDQQPKESGTYEYNLDGDYWRHIAKEEYQLVMWDKVSSGTEVLLKEENNNNYFLHPVESMEIHPTKLPDKIFSIVK